MSDHEDQGESLESFDDDALIEAAMQLAVCEALRVHKLHGNPICVWRDGRVVVIPPEDIEIADP